MAIELTNRTRRALKESTIEPNIIIKFEGLDVLFSATAVKEILRINDDEFFIGAEGYYIGGLVNISADKNKTLIDGQSTTYTIRQQMNYDEGKSSSISTMNIGLIDLDQYVTLLISPGQILEEMMGRKAQIFVTYGSVSFFEDALEVFKGVVTTIDSGSGAIRFRINHPDSKKKVNLFKSVENRLAVAINSTDTSITLEDASSFIEPSGSSMKAYLRIGLELIEYTTITGNVISGLSRGSIGSTAAAHDLGDQVRAVYSLEGNPIDLALQIMMSGHGADPIYSDIPITQFLQIGASNDQVANSLYFEGINIPQQYGLRAGDQVTISGAANAANNVTRTVTEVARSDSGFYVVVDGAALTLELESTAVMATFSQFNILPDGMRMAPDEVDIDEHEKIRDFFHSATEMRLYIKEDEIDGREFIDEQLYKPIACYSLPRKAKASIGYTVGPIPGEDIQTLDITNIKDPRSMRIIRTSARSFFNEVIYKYDDTPLIDEEKFTSGSIFISQTSKNRIKGANRSYEIPSIGLRSDLNAQNIIASNSQRILDRYKFAAETVECKALLRDTAGIEIGDIVVGDFRDLKTVDISQGSRQFKPRLFEVQNKTLNLKTGDVELSLLDTGLNIDTRYCLMSPTSVIGGVISQSSFVVTFENSASDKFGQDEFRKWEKIININNPLSIRVHNASYSIDEDLVVTDVNENTFTLQSPATIALTAGLIVEFTGYADSDTSDKQKLVYAYMSNTAFADGGNQYSMI